MPKPVDKESRISAGPCQQHQLQRETQQADVPNKLLDDLGNRENNDPDLHSESAAVDSGELLGKSKIDPDKVKYIQKVIFQIYPLSSKESKATEWSHYIIAVDEVNRRLNNSKNKISDRKGKK